MNVLLSLLHSLAWIALYSLVAVLIAAGLMRLKEKELSAGTLLTYGATFSVMLTSLCLWVTTTYTHNLVGAFWSDVVLTIVISAAFYKPLLRYWELLKKEVDWKVIQQILFDLAIAAAFISAFAILEKYLPEYDGYIHERMGDILIQDGKVSIFSVLFRPGFLYLFAMAKLAAPAAGLAFTKFVFPTIFTFLSIQSFRLWIKSGASKATAWLVVFSAPLFVSQAIYFRAQSTAALFFPVATYILFARNERVPKYLVLLLSILGFLYFHIFFSFILLFCLPFLFSELKLALHWNLREKILLLCVFLATALAFLPYFNSLLYTLSIYINVSHASFSFGSLGGLTSAGGELGSFSAMLKYYTHQILFFGVLTFVAVLVSRFTTSFEKPARTTLRSLWLATFVLFFGAEILPRFGFQYDPQRIWLFINLLLICIVIFTISHLPNIWHKRALIGLSISSLVTLLVIGYFVDTRLKTFDTDDRSAVTRINELSSNALIIGPDVKHTGIGAYKADSSLFFISFPHLIDYNDATLLDSELKWLSYTTPESRRSKLAQMAALNSTIATAMATEKPLPTNLESSYNDLLTFHSTTAQTVFIYVCNNIVYCSEPGYSYDTQNAQLSGYTFLEQVYKNDTVTVYQYHPTAGLPTPPANYVLLEQILLGSVDLTEYGTR